MIKILPFFFLLVNLCYSQECQETYIDQYSRLEICNESNWKLSHSKVALKVNATSLKTLITVTSETNNLDSSLEFLVKRQFEFNQQLFDQLELIQREEITIDDQKAILEKSKIPGIRSSTHSEPEVNISTIYFVHNDRLQMISNNCNEPALKDNYLAEVKRFAESIHLIHNNYPSPSQNEILSITQESKDLFKILKKGDESKFQNCLITKDDLGKTVHNQMKDEVMKKDFLASLNQTWGEFSIVFIDENIRSFQSFKTQLRKKSLDLKKAKFKSIEYYQYLVIPDLSNVHLKMFFEIDKKEYYLIINNFIQLESGWKVGEWKDTNIYPVN